jgi:hypothetical protein
VTRASRAAVEDGLAGGLAWGCFGEVLTEARRVGGVWKAVAFTVLHEKLAEAEADEWWVAMERAAEAAVRAKGGGAA